MEGKKVASIAPEGGFTIQNLGAALVAVQTALRTVIEEQAKHHSGSEWFDDLEKRLIRDAKGTVTEGIAIEAEANSLKLGIDVLQATLDASRRHLGLGSKE